MEKPKSKNFRNLVGSRFGRLAVVDYAGRSRPHDKKRPGHQWMCHCDCGVDKIVIGNDLKQGGTQSCGCLQSERSSQHARIDLTGQRFGKLEVLSFAEERKRNYFWLCRCDCGQEKEINGGSLRAGKSKSCGCGQGRFIHGMWGKPGYKKMYLNDPVKKIRHTVGMAVRDVLAKSGSSKQGQSTFSKLPYTPEDLKRHIESLWEPWMSWENYGGKNSNPAKTWHIDHVVPQVDFSYTSLNDPLFQECWALSNLRPLEKIANLKKGSK